MIIVAGYIDVNPDEREAFLRSRQENIARSRLEDGCIEYTFSADSTDPGRVRVFECWASAGQLDVHLGRPAPVGDPAPNVRPSARELLRYEVGSAGPLRS